ncbi:hypothetical protein DPMN_034452 [Dreissena polymorpha]|uniref:Uncharacterized protein n=1 Tax=Dreissena polymorpha TaxID=45954 RepID=A0A9D4M936_DREPO|nr:hypothetical protein DPMN_034452 [Dreissena polymorpha]
MLRPRIMKLHRYIEKDSQMIPNDFEVTRSRSRIMKLHRYTDHDLQMTPIDFQVKGQGHSAKKRIHTMAATTTDSPYGGHACTLIMPRIIKLHRYIDHDSQMTPIYFEVTRYIDHDSQMTPIDFQVKGQGNSDSKQ